MNIEQTSSNIDTSPGITNIGGFTDIREEMLRCSVTGTSALGIIQQTQIHKNADKELIEQDPFSERVNSASLKWEKPSFYCCAIVYSL